MYCKKTCFQDYRAGREDGWKLVVSSPVGSNMEHSNSKSIRNLNNFENPITNGVNKMAFKKAIFFPKLDFFVGNSNGLNKMEAAL